MSEDDPLLEAPTALPGLQNYPALIIGFLVALVGGLQALLNGGGLDDGLSLAEILSIVGPALGGILVHTQVFAQSTVDRLAPRSVQRRVAKNKADYSPVDEHLGR